MYLEDMIDSVDHSIHDRYDDMMHNIMIVEVGVMRGMIAISGKKPAALPKWENVKDGATQEDGEPELWWKIADQQVEGKDGA